MGYQRATPAKTKESKNQGKVSTVTQKPLSDYNSVHPILQLQHQLGNQAVNRLLQTKLQVGEPGDIYEQEADQVAASVMRTPIPTVQRQTEEEEEVQTKLITPLVQRQPEEEEEEEKSAPMLQLQNEEEDEKVQMLQRRAEDEEEKVQAKANPDSTPQVSSNLEAGIQSRRGTGKPLPISTRAFMEPRFGSDFSGVRVHTDSHAASTASELNAQAFTTGQDVFFGSGYYEPQTTRGKSLLAHELTHTIQQTGTRPLDTQTESAEEEQEQEGKIQSQAQSDFMPTITPQVENNLTNSPGEAKQITPQTPAITSIANKEQKKIVTTGEQQTPLEAKKLDSITAAITPEVATAKTPSAKAPAVASETAITQPAATTSAGGSAASEATASVPQEVASVSAEDPGQIIEQLKNTAPTQAAVTYANAQTASVQALEKQRQQVQATIPEIPAPTGLAAQPTNESGKAAQKVAKKAAQAKESATGEIEGETSGEIETKYETSVPEVPAASPPSATQLAGGEVSEEGQPDATLSRSAQNALENVQINTNSISTSAGERPNVDLSGEANPTQIETSQAQSGQEVSLAKTKAAQAINQDFGENNIFPQPSNETLKANKELSAISPPEAKTGKSASIPAEVVGGLNQSLSPFLREKIGAEQDKYKAGKDKFDVDSAQAHTDANQEIVNLNEETQQKQLAEQQKAKSEVAQYKQEWQTELDGVEKDYQDKAGKATLDQRQKIDKEKTKGEEEAAKHLEEAEQKAESEKQKANKEVAQKKKEAKKKSGGFWGWVKSKAKALIDGIKKAVNFVFDKLRKAIKFIFEAAKKLVLAAIDLARKAIVGLIKAFGEILKGLVDVVFAAFPEIANKINAKIDKAVNKAVEVVNAVADALKTAVAAVLDFLANALDSLLKLIQDIYNGIFTVIGMIITGELGELLKRIGNLIDAAKTAPSQFETAALEELLGGNLDQPLSPQELGQAQAAGINIPGQVGSNVPPPVAESELPRPPWTSENIGVDAVENNMELSPELVAELMQQTNGDGEVMLGESNDPSRYMESVLAEVSGDKQQGGQTEQKQYPDDGLTPRQRAEIKWELMKQGISQWWSDNWPIVIAAGVLGVVAFIAANIVTGGAIIAALPAIMSVVGPLFVGVTIATIAGHIRDYLAKGWEGDIKGAGKSLAKGLAAGAIELISLITFKAGSVALKGAKAGAKSAKAAGKAGVKVAQSGMRAVAKGAKYTIARGKVLFKGIAGTGVGKQSRRLQDLGKGLLARMRFKAFRIRIKNRRFKLEGLINPWVLLATGKVKNIDASVAKNKKVGDVLDIDGQKGLIVGKHGALDAPTRDISQFVQGLRNSPKEAATTYQQLMRARRTITVGRTKEIISQVGPGGLLEMVEKLGVTKVSNLARTMGGTKLGSVIRENGADAVATMLRNYDEIADLPGAQRFMDSFISGGTTAKGAIGEIQYAAQLRRNGVKIKQLEDMIGTQKAADIVLHDGKIIDVKNINWTSSFYQEKAMLQKQIQRMTNQVLRRQKEYPGAAIRYAFIGSLADVPKELKTALKALNVEIVGVP